MRIANTQGKSKEKKDKRHNEIPKIECSLL